VASIVKECREGRWCCSLLAIHGGERSDACTTQRVREEESMASKVVSEGALVLPISSRA
jgi:hypothetical protein